MKNSFIYQHHNYFSDCQPVSCNKQNDILIYLGKDISFSRFFYLLIDNKLKTWKTEAL